MSSSDSDYIQRGVLPIPDFPYKGLIVYDAKSADAKFPPIKPIRPPKGAPNIVLVLLDDVGFGASSAFGGPINTPVAEALATDGLRYTRFHTTALCSPTRAALLTGRNHHTVGMGGITEIATSAPGNNSMRPNYCAPLAKILKYNGYSTAHFGKCHEVPVWETGPVGPFDHWPTFSGFEKFYGFVAGETNQWYPEVYDGRARVTLPKDPNYHFLVDMTDQAINWIRTQKAIAPEKPFFVYFAPGATHAPHHVPQEWADRYKGKFDDGWDNLRERTIEKQKELGVIPKDAKLTTRHREIPAWEEMPQELKPVLRREMEVYAGYLEFTDYHVGRLLDSLKDLGILDDTLVFYVIGDNGASAEGTLNGTFNEMLNFNGAEAFETPQYLLDHLSEFGGPKSYNHYAVGWAHAMCCPYQWTKQVASHFGGTRNGLIVHWPKGIKSKGELRSQFHHVIDLAPTILELAGIPEPQFVEGIMQKPMEGVSMEYTFEDASAPDRHDIQYFEMFGNRGVYFKGWTAVTKHRTPWELVGAKTVAFDDDNWELYDTSKDWTQAEDLAKQMPDKLHELQRQWLIEATRYNVLPMDDRSVERFIPELAGRPKMVAGDTQFLYPGMILGESGIINIKNKSHSIAAEIEVPSAKAEGAIVAQGANFGGWALYARNGKLKYCYNFLGLDVTAIESSEALSEGKHLVRMDFKYDGEGLGKGGAASLFIDDRKVAEGRIERTAAIIFSADSTCMVGDKIGAPISDDFKESGNNFNGKISWVRIEVGSEDTSRLIKPDEWIRVKMSIQ
ncbi:MAG: arylsulfatase [Candidatus Bathyarchaeota archaeon]|nr:arylsulfatase [Candidatus Bathyarchaeota archaeon]